MLRRYVSRLNSNELSFQSLFRLMLLALGSLAE